MQLTTQQISANSQTVSFHSVSANGKVLVFPRERQESEISSLRHEESSKDRRGRGEITFKDAVCSVTFDKLEM